MGLLLIFIFKLPKVNNVLQVGGIVIMVTDQFLSELNCESLVFNPYNHPICKNKATLNIRNTS